MKNNRPSRLAKPLPTRRDRTVALVEPLEERRLLADISGNIWNDADSNGLKDFFEDGLAGVTVFLDTNTNRQLDDGEITTTTDGNGDYAFRDLPVPDGGITYAVYRVPEVDGFDATFGATAPGIGGRSNAQGNFNIDIVYADDNLGNDQKTLIETAINKWEEVILGDLPDIDGVDDLEITVVGANVDGPFNILAFAGPRAFRDPVDGGRLSIGGPLDGGSNFGTLGNAVGLPYRGQITIDLADIQPTRAFIETVTHEIGHVLGFGTLWDDYLVGRGTNNPSYNGENAVREDGILFDRDLSSLPVEPQVEGHWDENAYGDELETPFAAAGGFSQPSDGPIFAPLSRMTVGAMQDFGYEVNYAGSEPYGPFDIGVLPSDAVLVGGDGRTVPFEIGAFLADADSVVDDANFGMRQNSGPADFFFQAGPVVQQVGRTVRLLSTIDTSTDASFTGDGDFRDSLVQVNYYRESNGTPGLQTGDGGDELLFEDADRSDGFDFQAPTEGLDLGEQIFYARGFDQAYFTVDRALIVNLVDGQEPTVAASGLQAIGTDTGTIFVNFNDNAENEGGFLIEASSNPDFTVTQDVQRIYLPPSDGTGPVTYQYKTLEGPATTRYFRVRAFNTAGFARSTGQVTARTLSRGEILVDNDTPDAVTTEGFTRVTGRTNAVNGSYLQGTSGFADFNPGLTAGGNYFVFVRSVDIAAAGSVAVSVFGADGELLDTVDIDQSAAGASGDVLLGSYALGSGSFVRVAQTSGTATADTVRLLPVG